MPIPGGFPAAERIPNATQVRLSPSGIQFLEDNAEALIAPLLADLLGPGSSMDDIRISIPPIQAAVFDATVVNGFAGVCMRSSAVATASANSGAFSNDSGTSGPIVVTQPTAAIVTASSGLIARDVQLQRQNSNGSWSNVCSASSTIFIGSFANPTCGADIGPGTYRVRTEVGWPAASSNASFYLGDNNNCQVSLDLRNLDISAVDATPDRIRVDVGIHARAVGANGQPRNLPVRGFGIVPNCSIGVNTNGGSTPTIDFRAEVAITEQTGGARAGYGKFELLTARFTGEGFQAEDISFSCSGAIGGLAGLFDGIIRGTIEMTVEGLINEGDLIQQFAQLPQPAVADPTNNNELTLCPTGSAARDGICYQDTNGNGTNDSNENTAVPLLLGLEGRLDMGDFLSSISPGLRAAVDIIAAVDGEATAVNVNGSELGYTIDLFGGFNTLQASSCIEDIDNPPALPTVAAADAFRGGEGDANHISLGLSEDVMNYGAYQLWRSGALCLQVTTRLSQLLSTGLFSVFIGSLKDLAFPGDGAALGIALRPQQPPLVTLGAGTEEDPFVTIALPSLAIDFYVWSTERYVRFMTFTADLVAAVNLPLVNGAIMPQIVSVDLDNSAVSNNELIREPADRVTLAVESVVPLGLSMVGALPSFNINELLAGAALPIGINLADDAIRLTESNGQRFLGVFVDLEMPTGTPFTQRVDTNVELVTVNVPDNRVFALETLGQGERPSIEIAMSANGPEGVEYEYQYQVDGQIWSGWSRSPYAVISDDSFILQGRHTVAARARVVGATGSTDFTPARAEFLIDVLSPDVESIVTEGGNILRAADAVSRAEALEYRFREVGATDWSSWTALGTPERLVAEAAGQVEFQVRDEAGNIGSNAQSLRGLPPPSDGGGCGDCSVGGETDTSRPLYGLLSLLALGLMLRRRRPF